MKKIIIFGASFHSKVVADIIEKQKKYLIAGFVDSYSDKKEHFGYPILGGDNDVVKLFSKYKIEGGVIGIGDGWMREKIVTLLKKKIPELKFITAIHPSVVIGKGVRIGEGSVVMANAVINPDTVIGKHCIINTSASVDHDNIIGDYASILPGAITGGNVTIGNYSVVALGARVAHKIKIGKNSILGMGAVALKNIPDNSVAYGIPAKVVRLRIGREKFFSS